jgi:PKD repeat protein
LKQEFCGFKDSIFKPVTVVKPTQAPVADFIASNNQVEVYYTGQLLDLSTNGAYKWSWQVISPNGTVMTSSQQNPVFSYDEEGKWDVCLTSQNDIGPSSKVCKSKYIDVTPPSEFYMGPNHLATNQGGVIHDNGGPDLNYGKGRKVTIENFKILP